MSQQVPQPVMAIPASRSVALDIYRGAIWGDFDRDLEVAGALTQAAVGFIPGVGTVCALRDLIACIGRRDLLGIVLNMLAAIPVFGGLAKTADALHTIHRYRQASERRRQRQTYGAMYVEPAVPARNGWASFGLSLLAAVFAALYGFGVRTLFEYLWVHGPTIQGYDLHGFGAWLAPLILLPLGLIFGVAVTIRDRLWLGLLLLPIAMAMGFAFYLTGLF
jgi:hypothetical protein